MLRPIVTVVPLSGSGSVTDARSRSASTSASAGSVFSQTMLNSSPPSRAAVSLARSTERSRSANVTSTRSPIGWPSSSLIALKPSRSMISTQVGRVLAAAALEGVPQPVLEQQAVGQAGQRVVQRAVDQLRPRAPSAR